jgi:hypothetical protein
MTTIDFGQVIASAPLSVVGIGLFLSVVAAGATGHWLGSRLSRRKRNVESKAEERSAGQENCVISAVLGLLALLMGFTLAISLDRYNERRELVVKEANAIGTAYLRAQLLDEPHRGRISGILVAYTDNRISLASAEDDVRPLLSENDRLLTALWAAVSASMDSIKSSGFANSYLQSFNEVIDLDTERRVARQVRVPQEVFLVLYIYLVATAAMLGSIVRSRRGRVVGLVLAILLTFSMGLIIDINRPTSGGVRESQRAMLMLRASMRSQPTSVYDQYKAR